MGLFGYTLAKSDTEALREDILGLTRVLSTLIGKKDALKEEIGLSETLVALKKRIVELEITASKKQEDFDRRERELTHMIGLEKKRQEVEVTQATKAATLAVREANLDADKKRFEETVVTNKKALEDGFGYMRDVLKQVLERLPTVTVNRK